MVNTSKDAKVEHPKIICIMNVARKCMNSRMFYFSSVNYKAGMNVVWMQFASLLYLSTG